jgi:hypothetical protein
MFARRWRVIALTACGPFGGNVTPGTIAVIASSCLLTAGGVYLVRTAETRRIFFDGILTVCAGIGLVVTWYVMGRGPALAAVSTPSAEVLWPLAIGTFLVAAAGTWMAVAHKHEEQAMAAARNLGPTQTQRLRVIEELRRRPVLLRKNRITREEIDALSQAALLGKVQSIDDVMFMLRVIRTAARRG